MTEYDFVSIPLHRRREGLMSATDHRDIIRERAAEGWTFVQAIPLEHHVDPRLDLVFIRNGASR